MRVLGVFALISMTLAAAVLSTFPAAAAEDESSESGGNATVGDIQIYYEIHVKGKTHLLIMGHGHSHRLLH